LLRREFHVQASCLSSLLIRSGNGDNWFAAAILKRWYKSSFALIYASPAGESLVMESVRSPEASVSGCPPKKGRLFRMRFDHQGSNFSLLAGMFLVLASVSVISCTTTTTTSAPGKPQIDKSTGFFGRVMDQLTTRECLVAGFACPYGFGAAGEPCDCTDPSGRILDGRTIK
jgi:hypothetical protein